MTTESLENVGLDGYVGEELPLSMYELIACFHEFFNYESRLMPSPSAFSKFGLSILNFFKHAQFFMYTQNHFGILKS